MKKKVYIAPSMEKIPTTNIDIITESFTKDLSSLKDKKGFALNEGNLNAQVDEMGSITLK